MRQPAGERLVMPLCLHPRRKPAAHSPCSAGRRTRSPAGAAREAGSRSPGAHAPQKEQWKKYDSSGFCQERRVTGSAGGKAPETGASEGQQLPTQEVKDKQRLSCTGGVTQRSLATATGPLPPRGPAASRLGVPHPEPQPLPGGSLQP